jgi:hypothetical protein
MSVEAVSASGKESSSLSRPTRRGFLQLALATTITPLLSSCDLLPSERRVTPAIIPSKETTPAAAATSIPLLFSDSNGYQLPQVTIDGKVWSVDRPLEQQGGLIQRLRFDYDTDYPKPGMQNGAVGLDVTLTQDGAVRMMTEEKAKRPRFLFNDTCPYLVAAGERLYKHPYIEVETGDIGRIFVGFGPDTYQHMRVYDVQRDGDQRKLIVMYMGIVTIDPSTLPPPEQAPKPCPPNFPQGIR